MTGSDSPPRISVASTDESGRMHAPAAERNADAIKAVLKTYAPKDGCALELASGTGQHMIQFAHALPNLTWQPTEVADDRLASIAIWVREAGSGNVLPPIFLDATQPGWHAHFADQDMILLVNLLHLISDAQARILIAEAGMALCPGGKFIFYGPFLRSGVATSDGDRRFHASLQAQDPQIGYKNDTDVLAWVNAAGLQLVVVKEMPANNLIFVTERPGEPR